MNLKICCSCRLYKSKGDFSDNQWIKKKKKKRGQKNANKRRCIICIDKAEKNLEKIRNEKRRRYVK